MANISAESDTFTRKEAADYLRRIWKQRVSATTLAIMACSGKGPAYTVITGSGTFYKRSDIDKWAGARPRPGKVAAA